MTTTERPERARWAAAAPAGPPPRTTTSHSGQTMWWSKEAFIFDILHFVRNGLRDDKTELRPLLDHVYVLPTFRHPLSIVLLTAPHLIRTLAGPPVHTGLDAAIVEVGLPRHGHSRGQRTGRQLCVDAEQALCVVSRLIK